MFFVMNLRLGFIVLLNIRFVVPVLYSTHFVI